MIPKIAEHKITVLKKPGGRKQYIMTLPKEYTQSLEKEGVDTLFIVFNKGLGAFPKIPGFTEDALLTFMKKHPKLAELFSATTRKGGNQKRGRKCERSSPP